MKLIDVDILYKMNYNATMNSNKLSRKEKLDFILATRGITRDDTFMLNEYALMSDSELDIEFDYYYNCTY
jgi:hypothetical protein